MSGDCAHSPFKETLKAPSPWKLQVLGDASQSPVSISQRGRGDHQEVGTYHKVMKLKSRAPHLHEPISILILEGLEHFIGFVSFRSGSAPDRWSHRRPLSPTLFFL